MAFRAIVLGLLLVTASGLLATENITILLGDVSRDGWYAKDVSLQLQLASPADQYTITASEFYHPALDQSVKAFRFVCTRGRFSDEVVSCEKGVADFVFMGVRQKKVNLNINIKIKSQLYVIQANNIKFFNGFLGLKININKHYWHLRAEGKQIQLASLTDTIPALSAPLEAFPTKAELDFSAKANGTLNGVTHVEWHLNTNNLSFSDQSFEYLGEDLGGGWRGEMENKKGSWVGSHELKLNTGELLTPQFYLSAKKHPVFLQFNLAYQPKIKALALNAIDFRQDPLFKFTGEALLSLADTLHVQSVGIRSSPADLSALFKAYFQPVLVNPLFEDIELAGKVAIEFKKSTARSDLALTFEHIHLEQGLQDSDKGRGQFALYDLNGKLNWSDQETDNSQIRWQGGHLFGGITLGPTSLQVNMSGDRISLLESTAIPILDGNLQAEKFELTKGSLGPKVRFQGYLTPISMEAISNAIGWPLLSGQLSGMIPGIAYENGVIAVEGLALVKIFDGDILIKQLKLDDLFGSLPALTANLELKNIDLETLTRAFSFGKITGKLAGRVDGLRLENWAPISFDARFATPPDDESRHRINQKAVDNISNLGGAGVSGAISRSFLRFFEEFGYDRIGISCRLERGVCHMGGIESAEKGYYLVKGGGIPRIDILGFNRRTDWHVLVSKLKQISQGGAPVIE